MGQQEATRQADTILPMVAAAGGVSNGAALAVTTTAGFIDLASVPGLPATFGVGQTTLDPNPLGHYVDLQADGGDVYILFGSAQADVTGSNKPAPATNNSVNGSGVMTPAAGVCQKITNGTTLQVLLPRGGVGTGNGPSGKASPCRFLGYVTATSTATLRINQSAP